jgi:hypothetical protein
MSSDLRQFLTAAKQLGFTFDGFDGRNHVRLHNPDTGDRYSAAFSPSDWRSTRNALAALQRLSGRRLPRQRNGKYRHHPQPQLDTTQSAAEKRASVRVAALMEEAESVRRRIEHLAAEPTHSAIAEMRRALAKFERLRLRLAQMHHHIDQIGNTL